MSLAPTFKSRSFTGRMMPEINYQVTSMRWDAVGGCAEASITCYGPEQDLWEMIELLRCPVEIRNETGRAAWWGYVNEVQVRVGAIEIGVTLDSMKNKVAVAYSYIQPGTQTVGQRKTTSWSTDSDSVTEYGTKEFLSSQSGLSTAAAEAMRAAILAAQRYPQGTINPFGTPRGRARYSGSEDSQSATLTCKGWWNTLGWRYASIAAATGPSYTSTSATEYNLGSATTNMKIMEVISLGGRSYNALGLSVYAKKHGSPADNLVLAIYEADDNDVPVGSAKASVSIPGGDITTSLAWVSGTFSTETNLDPAKDYCIHVTRSGAADANNYYIINVNESLGYTSGIMKIYNGTAWVARNPDADMPFSMSVNNNLQSTYIIRELAENFGEFITAVDIEVESGISVPSYRDGDTLVLDEILEMLEVGGVNNRRLLASVDIDRRLWVWEEPANTAVNYRINRYGELLDRLYSPVDEYAPPVGVWCLLHDVIPASADVSKLNAPELQFIEGATWSEDNGLLLQFRGQPSIDDLFKIER